MTPATQDCQFCLDLYDGSAYCQNSHIGDVLSSEKGKRLWKKWPETGKYNGSKKL